MTDKMKSVPSVSVSYARNGSSTKANAIGMRPMQERAYEKRGEAMKKAWAQSHERSRQTAAVGWNAAPISVE